MAPVNRTGDIGLFKITSEGGVSAACRIEAVTGQGALDYVDAEEARLAEAAELLGGSAADVVERSVPSASARSSWNANWRP